MYDKFRKERQELCTTNLHQPLPHPPPSTSCFQDFCDCSLIPVCATVGSGCSNCGYLLDKYILCYTVNSVACIVNTSAGQCFIHWIALSAPRTTLPWWWGEVFELKPRPFNTDSSALNIGQQCFPGTFSRNTCFHVCQHEFQYEIKFYF